MALSIFLADRILFNIFLPLVSAIFVFLRLFRSTSFPPFPTCLQASHTFKSSKSVQTSMQKFASNTETRSYQYLLSSDLPIRRHPAYIEGHLRSPEITGLFFFLFPHPYAETATSRKSCSSSSISMYKMSTSKSMLQLLKTKTTRCVPISEVSFCFLFSRTKHQNNLVTWPGVPLKTYALIYLRLQCSVIRWGKRHPYGKHASYVYDWLVVSTPLKNSSQNGNLPQIGVNMKNIWNHHLDIPRWYIHI